MLNAEILATLLKCMQNQFMNSFGFDAVTLHPYMGKDSLQPFLDYTDKMNYILVLTSNPGANGF